MIKAGIIGATGYAGVELVRLLLRHSGVELTALSSVSFEGKKISEIYPSLAGICEDTLVSAEQVIAQCDVVFASLPHGLCEEIAQKCVDARSYLIDLGADFRLTQEEDYREWYGLEYHKKELHDLAVYCIPELHRDLLAGKKIVGNPGCYPTSIALALAPIMDEQLIDTSSIIIDSKSGVTGAGRSLSQTTHYPDCNEAFAPYKVAQHRHTPEIEQTLSALCGQKIMVTFVPHLLPVNRGIVSTIYVNLKQTLTKEQVHQRFTSFYKDEKFVRILPLGQAANLKNVTFSNYCDISLHLDQRTNRLIVVSTIDNMIKGAAGQAIQNMNLLTGMPETLGIDLIPPAF